LFEKQPELDVLSDVTLHENMTPLTVEYRVLIKKNEKRKKG